LSTQLELACRLGYIGADERDDLENEIQRVQKLLGGVIREINRRLRARGAALSTVVLLFLL
jgi:hypothetical protein